MEKDDLKRMLLVMVLGIGIFYVYDHFFARPQREAQERRAAEQADADDGAGADATTVDGAADADGAGPQGMHIVGYDASAASDEAAEQVGPVVLGRATYLGPYAMEMELTDRGAGVRRVTLSDYFASVDDQEEPPDERQKFQLVQPDVGRPGWVLTKMVLDLEGNTKVTVERNLATARWRLESVAVDDASGATDGATYALAVEREGEPFVTVRKTFRLSRRPVPEGGLKRKDRFDEPLAYAPSMAFEIEDHSGTLVGATLTVRGPEGLVREETRGDGRMVVGGLAREGASADFKTAGNADKEGERDFAQGLDWIGAVNKYFAFLAVAREPADRFRSATSYAYEPEAGTRLPGAVFTSSQLPVANDRASVDYLLLAGPRDGGLLERAPLGQYGLKEVIQWDRGCCPCFKIPFTKELAQFMVWSIDQISRVVKNKGLAVIVLVLLVQIVLLPINLFSQKSMLKMQELQPELKKLQEKFKDDKQAAQVEQMKLMREKGANPLMGCLPMALQLPIWIALFTGISVAPSLRQEPFMLWINDLSRPDALLGPIEPVAIPVLSFIGNWASWQLNLLPLLMVVGMFLQMKQQPQAAAASSPETEMQQKMMKFMMPGMMLIFFYNAPAALCLYILTSSFVRYFEMRFIRWHYQDQKKREPENKPPKPKGRIGRWLEAKMDEARRLQEMAKKSDNTWQNDRRKKPKK